MVGRAAVAPARLLQYVACLPMLHGWAARTYTLSMFHPFTPTASCQTKQDGDIQLFSATARRLLTSTWLQGDAIRSVALLGAGPQAGAGAADAPYVLLGCESGNVRVVALLDGQGQPAAGARPVADLALQPYQGELLLKKLLAGVGLRRPGRRSVWCQPRRLLLVAAAALACMAGLLTRSLCCGPCSAGRGGGRQGRRGGGGSGTPASRPSTAAAGAPQLGDAGLGCQVGGVLLLLPGECTGGENPCWFNQFCRLCCLVQLRTCPAALV